MDDADGATKSLGPAPLAFEAGAWAAGGGAVPYGGLAAQLAHAARLHANRAINDYASEDYSDQLMAAVSTGIAVELLAKAHVCVVASPLLLAGVTDPETLLALGGHADAVAGGRTRVQTLSATRTIKLAATLKPSPNIDDGRVALLMRVRNGAAHLGLVNRDELANAVAAMVQVIDKIIRVCPRLDPSWWTADKRVLVALRDEGAKAEARTAAAKIAAAQSYFEDLCQKIPPQNLDQILSTISHAPSEIPLDHEVLEQCAVCRYDGRLHFQLVTTGVSPYGDVNDLLPAAFECPVCRLVLYGDELTAVDISPDEPFFDDSYEPDGLDD